METTAVPKNKIGLEKKDYVGGTSTLCTGCGHDQITNHIVSAFYNSSIDPNHVAKMSGIGCSSKTPAYFLSNSHGFNSVHGRMPSVATGAVLANRDLQSQLMPYLPFHEKRQRAVPILLELSRDLHVVHHLLKLQSVNLNP